ncbi:MAG: hypothetical protein LBR39_07170, partial [Coriobacteriales bacterium]|nr:hypothetical protein [Coriobacteriales bacterium]
ANALSYISLGLAYMLRAMGDTDASYEACSLISPLGLALRCQAWVENLYWPAVVLAAMALVLGGVAFLLCRMRDSGAGLLPQRKGRLHASPLLRGEWGLAWRLTRGTCLGWVVAGFICGAMYGSIFKDMSGFFESNELYSQLLGAGTTDPAELVKSFSAFLMQIMCVLLAIPVCMVAMKFAAEEKRGRMEQLYGKAVPRLKVIAGYLLIALLLGLVLLLVTALGMWLAAAAMMEHPPDLSMMVLSGLRYYPAMVLFAGLAALIAGLAPRFTPLLWVYLVYAFFISYMGNMLKLPALAEQISPLDWLKPVTTTVGSLFANFFKAFGLETSYSLPEYQPLSITVICIIGIVLAAFGCLAYRRRDIRG